MKKEILLIIACHVFFPLIAGVIIYIISGNQNPVTNFFQVKEITRTDNQFIAVLANHGPDFCWSYSFSASWFILYAVFFRPDKSFIYFGFFLVVLSEFIQLLMPAYFTFDWLDVFVITGAYLCCYPVLNRLIWLRNLSG